jgi:hypothetical protein
VGSIVGGNNETTSHYSNIPFSDLHTILPTSGVFVVLLSCCSLSRVVEGTPPFPLGTA